MDTQYRVPLYGPSLYRVRQERLILIQIESNFFLNRKDFFTLAAWRGVTAVSHGKEHKVKAY